MLLFPFSIIVNQVLKNLLGDDADMLNLYLTDPDRVNGKQVQIANVTTNDEYNYEIGGGGTAAWVIFCGSGRNRD